MAGGVAIGGSLFYLQLHRVWLLFDDDKFENNYRVTALERMSLGFRRMLVIMFLYFLYRMLDYSLRRQIREQDDSEVCARKRQRRSA